jgi:hypothetical protein
VVALIMTPAMARADWIHDLVAAKFAHDKSQIYRPTPDPGTGTLWDPRNAAALSRHGWGSGRDCGWEHRQHTEREYDGEDWLPGWMGEPEERK